MNKEKKAVFSRHILLSAFGAEAQQKVLESRVCVVGCGGLGCGLLPYIVASGVGEILLVDKGEVEASNLQRQIIYGPGDIGREKAVTTAAKLSAIAHSSRISFQECLLSAENIADVITADFDLVIDCTDNFEVRYLLADYCWQRQISLLSAAVLEFEGHIMALVNQGDNPCLRCLLPEVPTVYKRARDVGVFGPAVGVMGTLQAVEAVKMLSGVGEGLEKSLLALDFLNMRCSKLSREADPQCCFCAGR